MITPAPLLYTTKEAHVMLGVGYAWLRKAVHDRAVPYLRPAPQTVRFTQADLDVIEAMPELPTVRARYAAWCEAHS